ncbi:hypothetical protein Y032_0010g1105 [Ancylostoma ceylanicum]|uniref:Uncharacterized protein n=1 Tax=Ancylostoma ceylanicum TaxID=53326 RepID=A0A016VG01_9BILA|nr:hypothetical protein Y032_0010g1105 [Ancylostoma ceylanicum]
MFFCCSSYTRETPKSSTILKAATKTRTEVADLRGIAVQAAGNLESSVSLHSGSEMFKGSEPVPNADSSDIDGKIQNDQPNPLWFIPVVIV